MASRKPAPSPWVCCFQLCFEAVYISAGCVGAVSQSLWLLVSQLLWPEIASVEVIFYFAFVSASSLCVTLYKLR